VEDGRVDELSKMMGSLTDTNRAAARELLQQAHLRAGEL
jgi:DNA repair ATPase RecN